LRACVHGNPGGIDSLFADHTYSTKTSGDQSRDHPLQEVSEKVMVAVLVSVGVVFDDSSARGAAFSTALLRSNRAGEPKIHYRCKILYD
jgi:hypothetical protein